MQNRWVARTFVGMIFVFPLIASALTAAPTGMLQAVAPVLGVETFLVAGTFFAFRERRKLVSELEVARTRFANRTTTYATTPTLHGSLVSVKQAQLRQF